MLAMCFRVILFTVYLTYMFRYYLPTSRCKGVIFFLLTLLTTFVHRLVRCAYNAQGQIMLRMHAEGLLYILYLWLAYILEIIKVGCNYGLSLSRLFMKVQKCSMESCSLLSPEYQI